MTNEKYEEILGRVHKHLQNREQWLGKQLGVKSLGVSAGGRFIGINNLIKAFERFPEVQTQMAAKLSLTAEEFIDWIAEHRERIAPK